MAHGLSQFITLCYSACNACKIFLLGTESKTLGKKDLLGVSVNMEVTGFNQV